MQLQWFPVVIAKDAITVVTDPSIPELITTGVREAILYTRTKKVPAWVAHHNCPTGKNWSSKMCIGNKKVKSKTLYATPGYVLAMKLYKLHRLICHRRNMCTSSPQPSTT